MLLEPAYRKNRTNLLANPIFISSYPCLNWGYHSSSFLSIWWVKNDVMLKFDACEFENVFYLLAVFVSFCCTTNSPKTWWPEATAIYLAYISLDQHFGLGSTGQFYYWSCFSSLMGIIVSFCSANWLWWLQLAACCLGRGRWGAVCLSSSTQLSWACHRVAVAGILREARQGKPQYQIHFSACISHWPKMGEDVEE